MIIYILLITHLLADFTFQSTKLAQKKINKFRYLVLHSFIYAGTYLVVVIPIIKFKKAILLYIIIIMSHFFIDWIRNSIDKKLNNKSLMFASFVVDQILHILILAVLCYAFDLNSKTTFVYDYIQQWSYFNSFIIYTLIFVIIWDPTAIFIKKLFVYIIDGNKCVYEENDPQIGRIIGKLERVIIATLVICNQFGVIGFVLTAKSIARYKQLEDKNFAERYLIGTLTSVSFAFITTIILKQFI